MGTGAVHTPADPMRVLVPPSKQREQKDRFLQLGDEKASRVGVKNLSSGICLLSGSQSSVCNLGIMV